MNIQDVAVIRMAQTMHESVRADHADPPPGTLCLSCVSLTVNLLRIISQECGHDAVAGLIHAARPSTAAILAAYERDRDIGTGQNENGITDGGENDES